ncbi:hypothetical protein BDR07DRAFT_1462550 [Suillus spraguei]|nr:hypothetical protein BDR07DRAFT_1462550 [Suillus spraguei]
MQLSHRSEIDQVYQLGAVKTEKNQSSLTVKVELVNQTKTTIVTDTKIDTIKKRQPSTKPMRVSAKITARNLCALDWQSNGHQKEPASVFACYWNGLSKTDTKRCTSAKQLLSSNQLESVLPATMWSSGWRDWRDWQARRSEQQYPTPSPDDSDTILTLAIPIDILICPY